MWLWDLAATAHNNCCVGLKLVIVVVQNDCMETWFWNSEKVKMSLSSVVEQDIKKL